MSRFRPISAEHRKERTVARLDVDLDGHCADTRLIPSWMAGSRDAESAYASPYHVRGGKERTVAVRTWTW